MDARLLVLLLVASLVTCEWVQPFHDSKLTSRSSGKFSIEPFALDVEEPKLVNIQNILIDDKTQLYWFSTFQDFGAERRKILSFRAAHINNREIVDSLQVSVESELGYDYPTIGGAVTDSDGSIIVAVNHPSAQGTAMLQNCTVFKISQTPGKGRIWTSEMLDHPVNALLIHEDNLIMTYSRGNDASLAPNVLAVAKIQTDGIKVITKTVFGMNTQVSAVTKLENSNMGLFTAGNKLYQMDLSTGNVLEKMQASKGIYLNKAIPIDSSAMVAIVVEVAEPGNATLVAIKLGVQFTEAWRSTLHQDRAGTALPGVVMAMTDNGKTLYTYHFTTKPDYSCEGGVFDMEYGDRIAKRDCGKTKDSFFPKSAAITARNDFYFGDDDNDYIMINELGRFIMYAPKCAVDQGAVMTDSSGCMYHVCASGPRYSVYKGQSYAMS